MRLWIVVVLAGCGPRCPGNEPETTSHEAIVLRRSKLATELAAEPCLPVNVELGVEGAPIACASESANGFALGPPLACWQIDSTTGRIWPRPPHILAGHAAIMAVDQGRIGELVVGPASWQIELDDSTVVLAINGDRTRAVVSTLWGGIDLQVFDLVTHAPLAHITSDEGDDSITGLAYVGDRIYRAGVRTVWLNPGEYDLAAWRDDGVRLSVDMPAGFDGKLERVLPPDPDAPVLEGELLHSRAKTVLLPFCNTRR
jgi:hypothetical protein